jgi:flagellar hook-length control protein FliK
MTRVGGVTAPADAATAPIRKGAPRDDSATPFADALLDLLATIPQPAPKPVVAKAAPPVANSDAGNDGGDTATSAAPSGDTVVVIMQAPPAVPVVDAAGDAATSAVVPHLVRTAGAVDTATAATVAANGADLAVPTSTDQPADASAVPAAHVATPPDAGAAAMQSVAALALAANGATLPGAQLNAAPVPSPGTAAPAALPQPSVEGVGGVSAPGDPALPVGGVGSTAKVAASSSPQFAAALITLSAQWQPPAATAGDGDALAGDSGTESTAASTDRSATAPSPLPDGLAQLLAATVRQVSHASTDADADQSAARPMHHAKTDGGAAQSATDAAPAVAAPASTVALPALAAGVPTPLLNGGQPAATPIDPGPRPMPESKATPAPTAHATLELDAAKTGASRIRIAVQGSQVRATITASDVSLASLDRQLPELRRSLEERGFSDVRLAVRAQDHVGTIAANASSNADDAQSFARNRPDQQSQRSTQQQDTGDRAGSQRRRRHTEDEPS